MGHMPLDPQDYVVNRNKQLGYLVDLDKKHLTEQYAGAVANYNGFITQVGTDPAAHGYPRPAVPMGPSLSPPDPKSGLMSILENSAPVCDPLPLLPVPSNAPPAPNTIHVGKRIGGNWFTVGAGDSLAAGATTPPVTSDDGVFGVFQKFGAPVGPGWYLLQG